MRRLPAQLLLALLLLPLAPTFSQAAPTVRPAPLQASLRQAARQATARQLARGSSPLQLRGAVQQALFDQLKRHRVASETQALRQAGQSVPQAQLKAHVERELDAFVRGFERPSGWESLSPGQQFGAILRAAKTQFAPAHSFRLAPAAARPLTQLEQLLQTEAGRARPAQRRYYGEETAKGLENYRITGQRVPLDLIKSVAQVKAAAALANMRTGRLERKVGGAIVKAAREVIAGRHDDQFFTDPIQGGAGTSVNMNVNEVIAARASEILTGRIGDSSVVHPNDHVNMAQSTNDVFPTAARLTAYRRLQRLLHSYGLLVQELDGKAKAYAKLPKPGRTHLQDAVPIMLGREFGAYAAVLRRDMRDIKVAMKGLLSVNMGATAIGTAINAEPAYVRNIAKILARVSRVPVRRSRDLVDATQNVDALTRAHAALKVSSSNLIKIANDLRLMNSGPRAGLGEITLPEVAKGSSIMPGKVNPVIAEVVNQIAYQVQGNDLTVNLAAQNGQFELNQMEPVLVHNLLQSIQILDRGSQALATKAIRGLKANDETCLRSARQMLGLATTLVPRLGYDRASQLAKQALKSGQSLQEVVVQSGELSARDAARLLDPARMARGGML